MNLVRAFFFWLYMIVLCVSGGAMLVLSASATVSEVRHLHAVRGDVKSTSDGRAVQRGSQSERLAWISKVCDPA
jgi:hypothetical protein